MISARLRGLVFAGWIEYVWPTAFWLMATDGHEDSWFAAQVILLSTGANAALYGIVGAMLWGGIRGVVMLTSERSRSG